MKILFLIALCLIYTFAGALIAIPYCLMAGWDDYNFPIVLLLSPVFLFIWVILASFAGLIRKRSVSTMVGNKTSIFMFVFWTIYMFLPVIFHWTAYLLKRLNYFEAGNFLEVHRYESPLIVLIGSMIIFILSSIFLVAKNELTNKISLL